MSEIKVGSVWVNKSGFKASVTRVTSTCVEYQMIGGSGFQALTIADFLREFSPNVKADMVNHPPHYKDASGIECIEVTKHMQFCGGSCFKYLYRCGKKHDDIEDLKKAAKYAHWAWENKEQVISDVYHLIADIAHHRTLGISDAMMEIANSEWYAVGWRINDEIARLESEQ